MIMSSFVILPVIWLTMLLFGYSPYGAVNFLYEHLDIMLVVFTIGACFEIIDRIIRGHKKSKIIGIIRNKEDRW